MMNQSDILIRRETPADFAAAEHLTREAFWNVYRPGCTEHYVLHVLRSDPAFVPELDLVMEKSGKLIGHIMYMHSAIQTDDGREVPTMTFGPISIHPEFQRQGYGKKLLDFSMEQAEIIANSIQVFDKFVPRTRTLTQKVLEDFQLIDYTLLASALHFDAIAGLSNKEILK